MNHADRRLRPITSVGETRVFRLQRIGRIAPSEGIEMSSLSVNGLGQGLGSLFRGPSAAGSASPAKSTSAASSTLFSSTSTSATGATPQVGGHHRHHGGHGGGKFQQIQDAVTSALQAAQSSGSTSNPDKVIEDAITKVFKQTSSISSTSSTSPSPQPPADSDGDTDAAGATKSDNTASQQAFFKSLQSLGVSPQQFKNDFMAAIQDAQQTGNVDVSAALKSLPKGTTLDAIG
jgi:hypothetical protein